MSMQTEALLEALFHRTGRSRREGNPLYAYRLENSELHHLRQNLLVEFRCNPRPERSDICAAFCLFAAEWFRRNHEDGPWKWDPIFEIGLGLAGDALRIVNTQLNRSRMVESGMQWWNLPLIETEHATEYLVSLACQGGLPLNTLRNNNGNLKRFFEECLSHHEQWPTEPLNDVVSSIGAKTLPVSLNNDVVIELGVLLVAAVAKLRRDSRNAAETAHARIAYLDQHCPRWQDSLPLRLDEGDQEPLQLLMGLLGKKPVKAASEIFPKVETTLSLSYSTATISRSLTAASRIEEEGLAKFLGLTQKEAMRPRLLLHLTTGNLRTPVAKLAKRATGSEFTINLTGQELKGSEALQEVRVTAAYGSEFTLPTSITGGQELGDVPWIFSEAEEVKASHRLIGLGSLRTRQESVLVVLPLTAAWESNDSVAELPQSIEGRKIVRVHGSVDVRLDDAVFRIRTKQAEESASIFLLTGRQALCGIGGSIVWAGVPRVLEVANDGMVQEVAPRLLQWRYEDAGRTEWQSGFYGCLGRVRVRLLRDGITVFHHSLDIFPRDFSARIQPGNITEGRIVLRGLQSAKCFLMPDERITGEVQTTETENVLRIRMVSSQRPDYIHVRAVFEEHGSSEFRLPCPTTWVGLLDAAGRVRPQGRPIPLSALSHLTLRVISPRVQVPQLVAINQSKFMANLRTSEKDSAGIFELPMSSVAARVSGMMSASSDMDDEVSLGVIHGISTEPVFRVAISRYPGSLEKERSSFSESETTASTDVFLTEETISALRINENQIRLGLAPLSSPDKPYTSDECRQIAPFRWRVFHDRLQPGPCLITPWLDDFTCLRPLRITVRTEPGDSKVQAGVPGSIEEFERISLIWDRETRRLEWAAYIDQISKNFEAPGWTRIDAMLKASIYRPLTTFEAIVALANNPMAMARIGIIHAGKQWVWDRMEELPFLWCLIPVSCWVRAALSIRKSMRAPLVQSGFPESQVDQILLMQLRSFLEGNVGRPAVLSTAAMCLSFADRSIPQDPNFQLLLPGSRRTLLAERDLERTRLVSPQDGTDIRVSWPQYDVPIAPELRNDVKDVFISDCDENQQAVLNGPAAAAAHSVFGVPVTVEQLQRFQELRGIDPLWFDRCFEITSCILAGQRFAKNPNWILEP
jgi:hypothetical protein